MKKREKQWKMMKKQGQKTMKNDDQERKNKKHLWKRVTKNETWWKREKQWKMMKKRETKTMKND